LKALSAAFLHTTWGGGGGAPWTINPKVDGPSFIDFWAKKQAMAIFLRLERTRDLNGS
jgi:hypothetical protein